jgi:hypothetical protein
VLARAVMAVWLGSLGSIGCRSSHRAPAGQAASAAADAAGWRAAAGGARYREVDGGRVYVYPGSGPIALDPADRGPHVLALARPPSADDRAALAVGLVIHAAADAPAGGWRYLVRLTGAQRAAVARLDFVVGAAALQPEEKIDPARLGAGAGPVTATVDLLSPSAAELTAVGELLASWGATLHRAGGDTLRVTLDRARLGEIGRISDVIWIEPASL